MGVCCETTIILPLRESPSEAYQEVAGGLWEDEDLLGDVARTVHVTPGIAIAYVSSRKHIDALGLERQRSAAAEFVRVIHG